MTPAAQSLEAILTRCGIALDGEQIQLLWRYHRMLREANAALNLTRIHNFENMVLKHYVDSLLVLKFVDLPAPLIDMGSGPGLPGIPLKIARPQVPMILAEPRGARALFLREVCEQLELKGVEVYDHKIGADYPGQVGGVITRAVGSIAETLDRVSSCLGPGGRMIFMKGPDCDQEISEAAESHAGLFRIQSDHAYTIPGTTHDRRCVVYERLEGEAERGRSRRSLREAAVSAEFAGTVREITSASNPTFQRCRVLLSGPGIRKHGEAILSGTRIYSEVLTRFPDQVAAWMTDTRGQPPPTSSIEWLRFSDPLFKELDVVGTHAPLLLVRVPAMAAWNDGNPWPDGCTLFVPFQDPENIGAVIRSAAAFGVARVVLLREAAHPFHPRSARAAGPALFQIPLEQGPALEDLRVASVPLIALDTTGPELSDAPFPVTFGLVVGVEGPGLPARLRQCQRRRIDMQPGVESLNAATAAAIALYVWSRHR
jgi:16S rRNA (guanine(527)-N(7))-methyltransferase RsmG